MNEQRTQHRIHMHRWVLWGFVVGVVIYIPALTIALLVPGGTAVMDYLTLGALLFRSLVPDTADWPGALNVGLAMLLNGLVYAVVTGALALIWKTARR